jgi:hypothetical protein
MRGQSMDFETPDLLATKRQLTWDMFTHEHFYQSGDFDFYKLMGLMRASEEVRDMEHVASHDRLEALTLIVGRIQILAGLAGEIAARGMLDPQDSDRDEVAPQWASLICIGATAIIADLVDKGLLIPGTAGGVVVRA